MQKVFHHFTEHCLIRSHVFFPACAGDCVNRFSILYQEILNSIQIIKTTDTIFFIMTVLSPLILIEKMLALQKDQHMKEYEDYLSSLILTSPHSRGP